MKSILENINSQNDNKTERFIYMLVFIGCAIIHCVYIPFFMYFGAVVMVTMNVASVLLYIFMAVTINMARLKFTGTVAYFEICIHSFMATLTLGWDFGFALYLICVVPLAFYIPYKKLASPFAMCLIVVGAFTFLKYFSSLDWFVAYRSHNLSDNTVSVIYILNSIVSFIMLLALSFVYNISLKRAQKSMRDKNEMLVELAFTDPLTKLSNRHSMYEALRSCFELADKEEMVFTIVLSDIDDFKEINDTYGHNSGDEVLKKVAQVFKLNAPDDAEICRWGGEEILMLLPDCDVEKGAEIADNLRKAIASEVFASGEKKFFVTMTFGVSENKGQLTVDKMISNADKNLYSGKRSGKNCVVC